MTDGADRRGLFVVFEGGDGVGKTTQVDLLVSWLAGGPAEVVRTHEPGDTGLGRVLRRLVLDPESVAVCPRAEALVYAADKAQHVEEVVRPALDRGAVVVCDRYVDSMLAYQGAGRVLDADEVGFVARWATAGLSPDLTVLLDTEPDRAVAVKDSRDRLEAAGEEFHRLVRDGFLSLAAADPGRYLVLDARQDRRRIAEQVRAAVAARLSDPSGILNR